MWSMWAGGAPIERVPGRSRLGYFAGMFLGPLGVVAAGLWFAIWQESSFGPVWAARDYALVNETQLLTFTVAGLYLLFWVLDFPMPLGTVEISPVGIRIDRGIRMEQLPWTRAYRLGNSLYTFGQGPLGQDPRWPTRWSMTKYQASRIALFLPG